MGAITFTKATGGNTGLFTTIFGHQPTISLQNKRAVIGTATFSSSYATGGDTFTMATVGLREIRTIFVDCTFVLGNVCGLSVTLGGSATAPTLIAFDTEGTQVSNGTNLSARSAIPMLLVGI